MKRIIGAAGLLALAAAMPVQQAAAQDVLGGALLGGVLGGVVGGVATGGSGGGIAIGAFVGAATGAIISSEAQRNQRGYYNWRRGCYAQDAYGNYYRVDPRYCY